MDRRQTPRVNVRFPVRIWGVDAYHLPFSQLVTVRNVSGSGAQIEGLRHRVVPGEWLDVQSGSAKAQFRIVWVGGAGTVRQGKAGLECLPSEASIWGVDLDYCACAVATS